MQKINKTLAMAVLFTTGVSGPAEHLGEECCSTCHGTGLGWEQRDHERDWGQPLAFGCMRCEEGSSRLDVLLDALGFTSHHAADLAVADFVHQNDDELVERLVELGVPPVCSR